MALRKPRFTTVEECDDFLDGEDFADGGPTMPPDATPLLRLARELRRDALLAQKKPPSVIQTARAMGLGWVTLPFGFGCAAACIAPLYGVAAFLAMEYELTLSCYSSSSNICEVVKGFHEPAEPEE